MIKLSNFLNKHAWKFYLVFAVVVLIELVVPINIVNNVNYKLIYAFSWSLINSKFRFDLFRLYTYNNIFTYNIEDAIKLLLLFSLLFYFALLFLSKFNKKINLFFEIAFFAIVLILFLVPFFKLNYFWNDYFLHPIANNEFPTLSFLFLLTFFLSLFLPFKLIINFIAYRVGKSKTLSNKELQLKVEELERQLKSKDD